MTTAKILYIGEKKGIHDLRFVNAMSEIFEVETIFSEDELDFERFNFDRFDLIVAAPLAETICLIPEIVKVPIVGISLAFDVNSDNDEGNLKPIITRCSIIVCDCAYIKNKIIEKYSYNKNNIRIVPYGCDLDSFQLNPEKLICDLRILVTRNWFPTHSNGLILAALQLLKVQGLAFSCTFVGDGPELQIEREKVTNSPISSQITFVGSKKTTEISSLMKSHNFYISASASDGSSVSLMEAMASGMICIVSDFPSNLEWIKHRKSGFLFQNGSHESLVQILSEILDLDSLALGEIARNARQIAMEKANWRKNKNDFLNILKSEIK